jgi:NifU-like protein involved in Fe-S cluster formation
MNEFGYSERVWEYFRRTPRAGCFAAGTPSVVTASARTPASGAVIELALQVRGDTVLEARFRAFGCPTTIAVGAYLAESAAGAMRCALAGFNASHIRGALEIPDERAHCALVGEDVLKEVLVRWDGAVSGH